MFCIGSALVSLALAGCGQGDLPAKPQPRPIDTNSPQVRAQIAQLSFSRDGLWNAVRTPVGVMLFARDKYGARIVSLRERSGYDVHRIEVDCAKGAAWSRRDGRGSATDGGIANEVSNTALPSDLSPELRRMCSLPDSAGTRLTVSDAVSRLRQGTDRTRDTTISTSDVPPANAQSPSPPDRMIRIPDSVVLPPPQK